MLKNHKQWEFNMISHSQAIRIVNGCRLLVSSCIKIMLDRKFVFMIVILVQTFVICNGHGRLIEPPNRSSAWRYGFPTPKNYNDVGKRFYRLILSCQISSFFDFRTSYFAVVLHDNTSKTKESVESVATHGVMKTLT